MGNKLIKDIEKKKLQKIIKGDVRKEKKFTGKKYYIRFEEPPVAPHLYPKDHINDSRKIYIDTFFLYKMKNLGVFAVLMFLLFFLILSSSFWAFVVYFPQMKYILDDSEEVIKVKSVGSQTEKPLLCYDCGVIMEYGVCCDTDYIHGGDGGCPLCNETGLYFYCPICESYLEV